MAEQIITRRCFRCKQNKPLSEFYKSKNRKYGRHYECKSCMYKRLKKYRRTKSGKDICNKVRRRYDTSEKGKVAVKRANEIYRTHYPQRIKANREVNHKIRAGKLIKPTSLKCHYCPDKAHEYHHHLGYEPEHWFDIVPVCIPCHIKMRLTA